MDKNTPNYNLNVVVRETGVKPDTLRAWERRYGLPEPMRTEGGHRLYSGRDIEMIKWFLERQDEGMRISQVVKMWQEMEDDGLDPVSPTRPAVDIQPVIQGLPADSALLKLRDAWVQACMKFDEYGAEQILAQAFARYPVDLVVCEVLQKGVVKIGDGWYAGNVTVQQEHFASGLALRRLNALISAAPAPTRRERILVGTPPGELHVISSLLVVLFLRNAGWDVTYLGANVPLFDLERTIGQVAADLVVFTATQLTTAASLLKVAQALTDQSVPFSFGGRIFTQNQELINYIPGYFLGVSFQGLSARVEEILENKVEAHYPLELPSAYVDAIKDYEKSLPAIHTHMINRYSDEPEYAEMVERISLHFSGFILAGLYFGNLSFVESEIAWADMLVDNNKMNGHPMEEYLQDYNEVLGQVMGENGQVIQDWLAELGK